ncbi:MAG: T9SS type A sorting domain-containing protein [Haliscomenobacter sp.]|uniref:T9SS type A sorting domain-containing protein n=1 Tax=Haliscomenobacter sp. TaxID=2717303 RepID=UPI0029AD3641|nr:T9SS type A sorting domain-containing protein [Haliscomenobacter sp.]MDX2070727.1 T9SS type A sorting domain-containing protein [Haliscomenobacter sp.]
MNKCKNWRVFLTLSFLAASALTCLGQDTLHLSLSDSLIFSKDLPNWDRTVGFTLSAQSKKACTVQFTLAWNHEEAELLGVQILDTAQVKSSHFGMAEVSKGILRVITRVVPDAPATPVGKPLFRLRLKGYRTYTFPDGLKVEYLINGPFDPALNQIYSQFRPLMPLLQFKNEPLAPLAIDSSLKKLVLSHNQAAILRLDQAVWPGDVDNSGKVNQFDVLALATQIKSVGIPKRPYANLDWYPQAFVHPLNRNGIDLVRADTDGNGTIELQDTLAIDLNWQKSIPGFQENGISPIESTGTPLLISKDTLKSAQSVEIPIELGTSFQPAQNTYGIAFTLRYRPDPLGRSKIKVEKSLSWLLPEGNQVLFFQRDNPREGRLDVVLSRLDKNNRNGYGQIARIKVTLEDVIFIEDYLKQLNLTLENIRLVDNLNQVLPIAPEAGEIKLVSIVENKELLKAPLVKLLPQPASDLLIIEANFPEILEAEVYSTLGTLVWRGQINRTTKVDVRQWPNGAYYLQTTRDGTRHSFPILIQH